MEAGEDGVGQGWGQGAEPRVTPRPRARYEAANWRLKENLGVMRY